MDVKNGKQYLPQSYQAYLLNKKKLTKPFNHINKILSLDETNRQNKVSTFDLKKGRQIIQGDQEEDDKKQIKQIQQKLVYSDYQKMFDDLQNNKFASIVNQIKKQVERLKQETPVRNISINNLLKDLSIQSLQNIQNLEKQFKVPNGKRNIEKIQNMLSFNKFFMILNRDKRFKIYDHCQFFQVSEGTQIYKQGDVEDYMYVVVKGCVKQYEKKTTSYHQKITVNFLSHYEGSSFGEPQLVGGKQQKAKRHHSTIATQRSYLLKIQNDFYRQLITNSAEDDFQKKIGSLLSTSIFCQTSKILVTPLLSTLERKTLSYGEVLIRQGEPVNKLYFIGDGNLQVMYIDRSRRNIKHLNIEEKPKNFTMKNNYIKDIRKKKKQKCFSMHNTFYYENQYNKNDKQFLYGHKKLTGEELQYNDHVVFEELRNGDFLGGKSFLSLQMRNNKQKQSQYFTADLRSKLSVVCSSIETTIYSLQEKKFFSLSDNLQKMIIDGIMDSPYFDEKDFEIKLNAQRQWKKYAQNLVGSVINEKKQRNRSFRL